MTERINEATAEHLTESIDGLSQHVEVLRNVLDEIREDFSWALRNDRLPIVLESAVVHRMALDPSDPDWGEKLVAARHSPAKAPPPGAIAEDLATAAATTIDQLAGRIETITHGLRDVREQVQSSLNDPNPLPLAAVTRSQERSTEGPTHSICGRG